MVLAKQASTDKNNILCAPLNGEHDNVGSLSYWQWFDFERAIFSSETVNRISRRLASKVKYLYVETVRFSVRRRALHVQPSIERVACIVLR